MRIPEPGEGDPELPGEEAVNHPTQTCQPSVKNKMYKEVIYYNIIGTKGTNNGIKVPKKGGRRSFTGSFVIFF